MKETQKSVIIFILGFFIGAFILVLFIKILGEDSKCFQNGYEYGYKPGYKQGQIDALNGIQNYDKVAIKDTIYIKIR